MNLFKYLISSNIGMKNSTSLLVGTISALNYLKRVSVNE